MGLFRTLTERGELEEVSGFDAQTAAEERAEREFSKEPFDRATVYVEDDDGEVLAFDVEVEMAPTFDASECEHDVPAEVVRAFATTRKKGAR